MKECLDGIEGLLNGMDHVNIPVDDDRLAKMRHVSRSLFRCALQERGIWVGFKNPQFLTIFRSRR